MEKINKLVKDWGTILTTEDYKNYRIKNVYIFKDGVIKVIANYFLDNFKDYQCEFFGEVKKKNKIDLKCQCNFVIKTAKPDWWNNENEQDLYINGDINNYIFDKLELNGERLDLVYNLNNQKCTQCIGWNHKEKDKIAYGELKEAYKLLDTFGVDSQEYEENIKKFMATYKKYKKIVEKEKSYTEKDYKKMSLASGTTEEENKMMLKNNGFEV